MSYSGKPSRGQKIAIKRPRRAFVTRATCFKFRSGSTGCKVNLKQTQKAGLLAIGFYFYHNDQFAHLSLKATASMFGSKQGYPDWARSETSSENYLQSFKKIT